MQIRLHGLPEEVEEATARFQGIFAVVSASTPRPDRGQSRLVRVYVEVRL